jgi:putative transposase
MPWQSVKPMEERERFVMLSQLPGANISELCERFGISRKTGYKLLTRFSVEGMAGLEPRSRRPHSSPSGISTELVCEIVSLRNAHSRWGGVTIRSILERSYPPELVPTARTIDRILARCGMVEARRNRRRRKYHPESVVRPRSVNDVWTVDFKGPWRTKDGKRCVPLTIRDEHSRYVLDIAALSEGSTELVKRRFIECFERYGLPRYVRSDNGTPFSAY